MRKRVGKRKEAMGTQKELRQIRNLLILSLLRAGVGSDDIDHATGMGASNIRGLFPVRKMRKKK